MPAYLVTEPYEGNGGVVFAKGNIQARRQGANEYSDGEIKGMSVRRAKHLDQYEASRCVPASELIHDGWHFECSGCGVHIDEYALEHNDRYRLWTPDSVIGYTHSTVYCDAACEASDKAETAKRKRREDRIIARMSKFVLAKFPDAELISADGYRRSVYCYCPMSGDGYKVWGFDIPFMYPGAQYGPGSLTYRREVYGGKRLSWSCAGGDVEVFRAWMADSACNPHKAC